MENKPHISFEQVVMEVYAQIHPSTRTAETIWNLINFQEDGSPAMAENGLPICPDRREIYDVQCVLDAKEGNKTLTKET